MKDQQDEIYDMSIKESQTVTRQALLQQKFHPGFQCFFRDFLEKASINFNQCFTQLVQGSRSLQQIKYSLPNILKMNLNPEEKKKLLSTKQHKILYFYQDDKGTFSNDLIDQSAKEQDTIKMLQRRLLMYQEKKQKLLTQKVEEIKKKKQPIEVQTKSIASPPQNEIPKLISSDNNSGNENFTKNNGKIL